MWNTIERQWPSLLGLLCVLAFFLAYTSPNNYTGGDAHGSLLTAQAILEHHTIRLDAYRDKISGYMFGDLNGHLYYNYPLGTSLFMVPAVWAMNLRGVQFWSMSADSDVQKPLAAMTVSLLCVLIFFLCRYYLGMLSSLAVTALFVLGSTLTSTLATALWSMNIEIIFIIGFLLVLVYWQDSSERRHGSAPSTMGPFIQPHDPPAETENQPLGGNQESGSGYGYALGALGFAAFLCRPTALTFLIPAAIYLFLQDRRAFAQFLAVFGILTGMLVAFSLSEFQSILPSYYLGAAFGGSPIPRQPIGLVVYGLLFSPGRGVFVYQPYLILIVVGTILHFRILRHRPLYWLAVAYALLHLALLLVFPMWWGGYSFGSRLFTDGLPALFLLGIFVWEQLTIAPTWLRRAFQGGFVVMGCFAIFVHVSQGLFNTYAFEWNEFPNIDQNVSYLLDWRFPQFLASPQQQADRLYDYQFTRLTNDHLNDVLPADSTSLIFENWSLYLDKDEQQEIFRQSNGTLSTIQFRSPSLDLKQDSTVYLKLRGIADSGQVVDISLNGSRVGHIGSIDTAPHDYVFEASSALFKSSGDLNQLDFSVPNAFSDQADSGDGTIPGFGFISLAWTLER